jgi:hypothetical protein
MSTVSGERRAGGRRRRREPKTVGSQWVGAPPEFSPAPVDNRNLSSASERRSGMRER